MCCINSEIVGPKSVITFPPMQFLKYSQYSSLSLAEKNGSDTAQSGALPCFVFASVYIVRKGVLFPTFYDIHPLTQLAPLLKTFVSPSLISVLPLYQVFQTVSSTITQPLPPCPNPTNQPSLVETNIKRTILPVQLSLSIKKQFLIF